MTWRSFLDFVKMREAGEDDATYRAYKLGCYLPNHQRAVKRMGIEAGNLADAALVPLVQIHLMGYGHRISLKSIDTYIHEWYDYDRIVCGQLHRFPKRKTEGLI